MSIQTVAIIGMGAMGLLLGSQMCEHMSSDDLRIVVNAERKARYEQKPFTVNGEVVTFRFVGIDDVPDRPVDLAIFAVKYNQLAEAISDMRHQIDDHTTIISVLNGIASERDLAEAFSKEQVLYTIAQGMDATRDGQDLTYSRKGDIAIGLVDESQRSRLDDLRAFFNRMHISIVEPDDILRHLWSKFMMNTGVNQVVGVYGGGYGAVQKTGEARSQMRQAMQEVLPIAEKEGVHLTEEDIDQWMAVIDGMSAEGKPSMLQDIEAGRPNEVELFSGTVRELAKKHGISVPMNDWLYVILKEKSRQGR